MVVKKPKILGKNYVFFNCFHVLLPILCKAALLLHPYNLRKSHLPQPVSSVFPGRNCTPCTGISAIAMRFSVLSCLPYIILIMSSRARPTLFPGTSPTAIRHPKPTLRGSPAMMSAQTTWGHGSGHHGKSVNRHERSVPPNGYCRRFQNQRRRQSLFHLYLICLAIDGDKVHPGRRNFHRKTSGRLLALPDAPAIHRV